jgi:RHH-type transcriptional regulator, rel operon repressor / antitoxin RelB
MPSPISIRLTDALELELEETSKRLHRPKSFIIKSALEQYFAEFSDYQIALDRLNDKDDAILSAADFRAGYGGLYTPFSGMRFWCCG